MAESVTGGDPVTGSPHASWNRLRGKASGPPPGGFREVFSSKRLESRGAEVFRADTAELLQVADEDIGGVAQGGGNG